MSGDLDAERIAALEEAQAPIDAYGVGTAMVMARSDPAFSGVYKLADVDDQPTRKLSATPDKTSDPGRTQVWRQSDGDVVGLDNERLDGRPLLEAVVRGGTHRRPADDVATITRRCRDGLAELRDAAPAGRWPVRRGDELAALRARMVGELGG